MVGKTTRQFKAFNGDPGVQRYFYFRGLRAKAQHLYIEVANMKMQLASQILRSLKFDTCMDLT
jgi:hypothetical protein